MGFAKTFIEGRAYPFVYTNDSPIAIKTFVEDGKEVKAIIDTGTSYYYGDYSRCFHTKNYVGEHVDYKPRSEVVPFLVLQTKY